ncbi:hypothetical protein Goshw_022233 [Gossypium schwendimanii]|uniref:Reverse transcriptase domain-containing protein n=1 Tax=Gossypium schwendimanii TaxID=34291 RepID=A0A7J9NAA2_GOSSC|nr:hypothetical protein [Gossypium schwendimanii]
MKSSLGQLPSYTWRSIWATKGILEAEMCWRIGLGTEVSVRADVWIPINQNQRIQNPTQDDSIQRVTNLIDQQTNNWNEDLINSTFDVDDARQILAIPLPFVPQKDVSAWSGEATGEYTDFVSKIIDLVLRLLLETKQVVLTGAQICFLNVEVEGDCLSIIDNLKENRGEQSLIGAYIHKFGLKRNEATYLVGDIPAYALDAVDVNRR